MFRPAVFVILFLLDRAAAGKEPVQLIKASDADIAELQEQSVEELVSILASKSVECSHCSEQEEYIDLVTKVWGWGPFSVTHPEGPTTNKTEFMNSLRTYTKAGEKESVHDVELDTHIQSEDDLQFYGDQWEAVWADFCRKMSDGSLEVREGEPVYDLDAALNGEKEFLEQFSFLHYLMFGWMIFNAKQMWEKYQESRKVYPKYEKGEECEIKFASKPDQLWTKCRIEGIGQKKDDYDVHVLKTDEPELQEVSDTHRKSVGAQSLRKIRSTKSAGASKRKDAALSKGDDPVVPDPKDDVPVVWLD